MFKLFRKKTKLEKLQIKHKKLLQEAFELQAYNRRDSDAKYLEADKIQQQIDKYNLSA